MRNIAPTELCCAWFLLPAKFQVVLTVPTRFYQPGSLNNLC